MKRNSYSTAQSQTAREQRKLEGETRNTAWRALSTVQKVASLDARLGAGIGAVRQRVKLERAKLAGGSNV